MRVTVLHFAEIRGLCGAPAEALELPPGETMDGAWQRLRTLHPRLQDFPLPVLPVMNRRYVPWSQPVAEEAEIAFLAPVSGG